MSLAATAAAALLGASCQTPSDGTGGTFAADASRAALNEVDRSIAGNGISNSIGMKLVRVPKGEFAMGSARGNPNADPDERQHRVTITRDYFLGALEVTQSQYERVMGRNPSLPTADGANRPVNRVSWHDAVAFCERLSQLPEEKAAGRAYRLPTEAEWEYACRAGNPGEYSFGDRVEVLGDYCWYEADSGGVQAHPVGQLKPNAWGLHDMHGNAWEWCADWYERYSGQPAIDPAGPSQGTDRVYRGGSVGYSAPYCRSANRTATRPTFEGFVGFRVAVDSDVAK